MPPKENLGQRIGKAIEKAGGPQAVRRKMGIAIPAEPASETSSDKTSIAISRVNQTKLNLMRRGYEDYDAIISRLVAGEIDTWTEIVSIDNELPYLHTCVFQLGQDAECFYYWDGKNLKQISFEDANKMMKQPTPNITLTKDDIEILLDKSRENVILAARLRKFLENQSSDAGKRDP